MTGQIVIRSSPMALSRRQPLLHPSPSPYTTPPPPRKSTTNVGEVAGGTAADVFIVCCCCPCVLLEFVVLAVYKVPATVVRRIWKKQRHRVMLKKYIKKNKNSVNEQTVRAVNSSKVVPASSDSGGGAHHHHHQYKDIVQYNRHHNHFNVVGYFDELSDVDLKEFEKVKVSIDGSDEAVELDKQMWDRFKNAGFWRSPSQRFDDLDE